MGQPGGRLGAADLGRVDGVRDHHDRAALVEEAFELVAAADGARVGQPLLNRVQVGQPRVVAGTRDGEHHEGASARGGPQGVDRYAIAGAGEGFVVRGEVVPVGQLSFGAHVEAEMIGGAGDLARQCRGGRRVPVG